MKVLLQHVYPRFWVTRFFGYLAQIRIPWIKNYLIRKFIRKYQVDLSGSVRQSVSDYTDFNDFFTRTLKPGLRPMGADPKVFVSPVDGYIYQYGSAAENPVYPVKGFDFSLNALLVDIELASIFRNGQFICMYLSPRDYHRVHMPIRGRLLKMIYVPGDYYSVNPGILEKIPGIFCRNERIVCLFETALGPMAYLMIGAMNVSSIYTVWAGRINENRNGKIIYSEYQDDQIILEKGAEVGYFQMGSTVMVFLPGQSLQFRDQLIAGQHCLFGEELGIMTSIKI